MLFVDGAAVASNLVGGDFRRFDFASDACGDRIGSAGSSDFHESSNPQVVWIRDAALVESAVRAKQMLAGILRRYSTRCSPRHCRTGFWRGRRSRYPGRNARVRSPPG